MTLACDVEESAGGARHPQVAGAGVEDHGKLLARRADLNLAIVLGLKVYNPWVKLKYYSTVSVKSLIKVTYAT